MKVYIKRYGWCDVLERNGNYALLKMPSGNKICWNITGFEIVKTTLF